VVKVYLSRDRGDGREPNSRETDGPGGKPYAPRWIWRLQLSRPCGRDRHQERERPSSFSHQSHDGCRRRAALCGPILRKGAAASGRDGRRGHCCLSVGLQGGARPGRRDVPLRVLGAEAGGLSPEVANEILSFFRRCIGDLSQRMGGPDAEARAFQVIATLEGGMMLARAYQDTSAFDQAAAGLVWPGGGSTGRAIARSESPATPRPNPGETR